MSTIEIKRHVWEDITGGKSNNGFAEEIPALLKGKADEGYRIIITEDSEDAPLSHSD